MSRQDWIDLAWWCCAAGAFLTTMLLVYSVSHWVVVGVEAVVGRLG